MWPALIRGEVQLSRVVRAVAISLGVVSVIVVLVAFLLLPADIESIHGPLYASITHCHVLPQSERAVSLVWYMPRDPTAPWRHQLVYHDLQGERPVVQFAWPELRPASMSAGRQPHELFVGCWDGSLWRIDLSRPNEAPKKLGEHARGGPLLIECSADGRWLATLGPNYLQVLDLQSGQLAWQLTDQVRRCAVHPDGRRILVSRDDGSIVELALATGQTLRTIPVSCPEAIHVRFSRDGRWVLLNTVDGDTRLLDWESGRSVWPSDWEDCPRIHSPVGEFSPSGERLITAGSDINVLAVWNLHTMCLERELCGHSKAVQGVAFVDDDRLCSFGADGTMRVWDLGGDSPPRVLTIDVTAQAK